MADDWIKFRKKLLRDGRVLKVSRSLRDKCPHGRVTVIGALVFMWALADDYADEDGLLIGYTPADLDEEIGIEGFCKALPSDWMIIEGDAIYLPEYQEHNGSTAKRRAMDKSRKRRSRGHAPTVTESGQVSRTDRDSLRTREEERREEENTPCSPPAGDEEVSLRIPEGWSLPVSEAAIAEWRNHKPSVRDTSIAAAMSYYRNATEFAAAVREFIARDWAGPKPPSNGASPASTSSHKPTRDVDDAEWEYQKRVKAFKQAHGGDAPKDDAELNAWAEQGATP